MLYATASAKNHTRENSSEINVLVLNANSTKTPIKKIIVNTLVIGKSGIGKTVFFFGLALRYL